MVLSTVWVSTLAIRIQLVIFGSVSMDLVPYVVPSNQQLTAVYIMSLQKVTDRFRPGMLP